MSGYIRLISGGVFSAIFIISIILFAINFANDNDSDINLINDSRFTNLKTELNSTVINLKDKANSSQNALFSTTTDIGNDEESSSGAQFKIGPYEALGLAGTSFAVAFNSIFGSEFNFILTAFLTMITFMIGFYTIKAWLGRSPD